MVACPADSRTERSDRWNRGTRRPLPSHTWEGPPPCGPLCPGALAAFTIDTPTPVRPPRLAGSRGAQSAFGSIRRPASLARLTDDRPGVSHRTHMPELVGVDSERIVWSRPLAGSTWTAPGYGVVPEDRLVVGTCRLRLRSSYVALQAYRVVRLLQPGDQFIVEVGVGPDADVVSPPPGPVVDGLDDAGAVEPAV